jgi:hypothetical protein
MAQDDEQTNLRIPKDLKAWLKHEAERSRRSVTAEIVTRLEKSRNDQLQKDENRAL